MKATQEEMVLIRTMLELPFVIKVLDADMKRIESSPLRTRGALIRRFEGLREDARHEMRDVRQMLHMRGIKITRQTRTEDRMTAEYICRGRQDRMILMWSRVKCDVEERVEAGLGAGPAARY
ncbi:hypothetical protein QWJ34_19155 [Saccharibacillus sp. CPCC 101409]|uniref:hypothetical protein n=1 Tax=Saccharibacillus sp. CPCC 101409 TaxID=3058041 RepID=UPI0026741433|nr:hypothetical protein [Saccharibacillus sp. CPCC 101409]MDO3411889.1 hypothetical protein [Saccharibacillus sp. CPCC 101409]